MKSMDAIDSDDVGVRFDCTLTFTDFDPTGATFELEVDDDPPRAMTWVSPVASYVTVADDFEAGVRRALVRVKKGAVSVASEPFLIPVRP